MAIQHSFSPGVQRRRAGLAGWLARLASMRARLPVAAVRAAPAARRLEHMDLDQRVREVGEW
ncbi:hypothetical protein PMI14_03742 [Acidovorax sp. CF316]|uniref:hypothetical protein n=1 Tax=Acidovorax sp. CF316 TaxID=1144317 RepID=UPI00026BE236|nr:hypothetical protein [Acidovorax sp. CF316]EJE51551.1 hypothetical protein PMI14_03742 [Acidovorax sp. CF316]